MSTPARSRRRRIAGLVAGLAIVVFLAIGVVVGWDKVSAYDWELRPGLLAAGLALLVLHYAMSALGYALIVERLADVSVDRVRFMTIWGRSMLARYVPGNVLMVASRLVLGKEAGVPQRTTLAASVYEQALALGAAGLGSIVLLAVYGASGAGTAVLIAAAVPLGLALLHPRIFGPLTTWVLEKAGREPLAVLLTVRQLFVMLTWYFVAAAVLGVGIWLVVRSAAGPEVGSVLYVGLSFLLSFVVSMLAFVFPSGLGVREGVLAALLSRNVPGGVAIALAAGIRLALTVAELVFVGVMVLVSRRSGRGRGSSAV